MKRYHEALYKLVNHKSFLLKLIRPSLTIDAAISVCRSMILTLIEYGNMFRTGLTLDDKADLQKLQNKVLRCCPNDPMDINVIEMHDLLNIDMVDERRPLKLLPSIHEGINRDLISGDDALNTKPVMHYQGTAHLCCQGAC